MTMQNHEWRISEAEFVAGLARAQVEYGVARADRAARAIRWWFIAYAVGGFALLFGHGDSAELIASSWGAQWGVCLLVVATLIQVVGEIADKCAWRSVVFFTAHFGPKKLRIRNIEVPEGADEGKMEARRRRASAIARPLNSWWVDAGTLGLLLLGGFLLFRAVVFQHGAAAAGHG